MKPQYRIWYIHQLGGPSYERPVHTPEEGFEVLETIYDLMVFLFDERVIPDYANMGGVEYLDEDGDWVDYHPEDFE